MIEHNKRLMGILLGIALILLVPLIAMQFLNEVDWTASDFGIASALLLFVGISCEMVIRKFSRKDYRVVMLVGILLLFMFIWVEMAVGLFGTPLAGN